MSRLRPLALAVVWPLLVVTAAVLLLLAGAGALVVWPWLVLRGIWRVMTGPPDPPRVLKATRVAKFLLTSAMRRRRS